MDMAIQRYKSSLDYRDALDRFLSDFEDSLLPEGPFAPFGVLLLNEQQIQAEWQSAKEVGGQLPDPGQQDGADAFCGVGC